MLKLNQNVQDVINHINKLDPERAQVIFDRIFENPFEQDFQKIFTEKESFKLMKLMDLNDHSQIVNIYRVFSFILMHAIAEKNFSDIESLLQEGGFTQEHLESFQEAWKNNSSEYANKMKDRQAAVTSQLDYIKWDLKVDIQETHIPTQKICQFGPEQVDQTSESLYQQDARNPYATIQFHIKDNPKNNFNLKFNKGEIQQLFEQMEHIQNEIDKLY